MSLLLAFVLQATAIQQPTPSVRLYEGLGDFHRRVKTSSALASKYLDQGFAFLYGFQYPVALSSFKEAAELDPNMVLAYWGIAAANGNNINNSWVSAAASKEAIDALTKGRALRSKGTEAENDLIEAAFARFSPEGPGDRTKLDTAYADAMRTVWQKHPTDTDVGALFAEAILNLRPWKQWTLDGRPEPGTEEALTALRAVLRIDSLHPQALHLWIHTIEGSQNPERGNAEADKLMDLQPGLLHMQHMPGHIYNRTGQWKKAVEANVKSAAVYKRLFRGQSQGLDYAHGRHMLAFAAAMRGQSELALLNIAQIFDGMDQSQIDKANSDYNAAMKSMFLVRFGRWEQILALPQPGKTLPFSRAMWHEARGVAYAAQKNSKDALAEQAAFEEARKAVTGSDDRALLNIAAHVLAGEVFVSLKKTDDAVAELRKAVAAEDGLAYGEPPDWILPTRHTLGAILLDAGRFADALTVFKDDLVLHPNNGWALYGLSRSYTGLGKAKEADKAMKEFKKAWVDADMEISSSCMCLPGKG